MSSFPSFNGLAVDNFKKKMLEYYGIKATYNDFVLMSKITKYVFGPRDQNTYLICRPVEQEKGGIIYVMRWIDSDGEEIFVAVKRKTNTHHIFDVLPREYLVQHFFSTIIFMTNYGYHSWRNTKEQAVRKCDYEWLTYKQWIKLNNQIMSGEAIKLQWDGETDEKKLFFVQINNRWFPVIWDDEVSLITGMEYRDIVENTLAKAA